MRRACLVVFLAGCSNADFDVADALEPEDSAADAARRDTSIAEDSSTSVDSAKETSSDALVCSPEKFPTFLRGCEVDPDCSFGFHLIDCCGTERAIGFAASERAKFEVAEAAHRMACPANCKCAVGATQTETAAVTTDKESIGVQCVGVTSCRSYVK